MSLSDSEKMVENPGNFLALLRFRAESGDKALSSHFSGPATVNYQSPKIQNEIFKCVGDWVRENILREVREQPFFSICADEAADCSNVKKFAEQYSCDMLPTFLNGQSLNAELDLWSSTMSCLAKPYDNVQDTLKNTSKDLFPYLHQLLRLVCTFPITTCETEHSVSALRTTMGQERMSSIALIHSNYPIDINYDEVIARFYALHPRRVSMEDMLKNCFFGITFTSSVIMKYY